MVSIINKPSAISFSMNLEKFQLESNIAVTLQLKSLTRQETVLTSVYHPSSDHRITIDVKEVIHNRLQFQLKESLAPYIQSELQETFEISFNGESPYTFTVLKGGIEEFKDSTANFLKANFLTWQPQVKKVTYYTPEYLTYYASVACTVKVKAYFETLNPEIFSLATLAPGNVYTIPAQYSIIASHFQDKKPGAYDVWVENTSGVRLSYVQRYTANNTVYGEQWVLFENSLGGMDTFRAYGETELTATHEHQVAEIDETLLEYRVDTKRKFKKNTGYLDKKERVWMLDFFPSLHKFIYQDNSIRTIIVEEDNATFKGKALPSSYSFTYRFASTAVLLNVPRSELSSELNISTPELGSFSIPPRLVEFPRLDLNEGVLMPVQHPYNEGWGVTSFAEVLSYLRTHLSIAPSTGGGGGHQHNNLEVLELISLIDRYLLVDGQKIFAAQADELSPDAQAYNDLLSAVGNDVARGLISFAKGLKTLDAKDSLTDGKGVVVTPDGRVQADSIEARGSIITQEFIINKLSALSRDFMATESHKIIEVFPLADDGSLVLYPEENKLYKSYRITFEKQYENDFVSFQDNDILFSKVNTLSSSRESFTWWGIVVPGTVDRSSNSLILNLYQGEQIPTGVNFAPVTQCVAFRWGNTTNTDRQRLRIISGSEGRDLWLEGLSSPNLSRENYQLVVGALPAFIAELTDDPTSVGKSSIYAKDAFFQTIHHIDFNDLPVKQMVDRGEWSLATAQSDKPYICNKWQADIVWRFGCSWQCNVNGTLDEPRWNSSSWSLKQGNKTFYIEISSSNGKEFTEDWFETILSIQGFMANQDVTESIKDYNVAWSRNSGHENEDTAWGVKRGAGDSLPHGKALPLTMEDVTVQGVIPRVISFKAVATLLDGTASNNIIYKNE